MSFDFAQDADVLLGAKRHIFCNLFEKSAVSAEPKHMGERSEHVVKRSGTVLGKSVFNIARMVR